MTKFNVGDRVYVIDPGLDELRRIMRETTGEEPPPNHTGEINEMLDDDEALIYFDDGGCAPYPTSDVRHEEA